MASLEEETMLGNLLPFHRRIVEELIAEDGLCILSAGMGWQKIVGSVSLAIFNVEPVECNVAAYLTIQVVHAMASWLSLLVCRLLSC